MVQTIKNIFKIVCKDLVQKLCEEQNGSKCESIADQLLDLSQTLLQNNTGSTECQPNVAEQNQVGDELYTLSHLENDRDVSAYSGG